MKLSENGLKWMMRLYPPMLLQRIWVQKVHKNFRGVDIKINRSFFTTNLGKATFGGTLFAAADPFYALLMGQIMRSKGIDVAVWLKSAEIRYLQPAREDCFYTLKITEEMINEAETEVRTKGKFVKAYPIEITNANAEVVCTVLNEIHIRDKNFVKPQN
jgi:hypothetical protein